MSNKSVLTFEHKLELIKQGIEGYMESGDFDKAGRLIEIANKMQGHNAPDKVDNSISIKHEDAIRELG